MNKYPKIVKLLIDDQLCHEEDQCPYCKSMNIQSNGYSATLVGFIGEKFSKQDSNHYQFSKICLDCGKSYTKHLAHGEVWITDLKNKVLDGVPNCFENFGLTCSYCNGDVERKYTDLDGVTQIHSLHYKNIDGKMVKQFKEFYHCLNCNVTEELK